eukprot:TRINITY_DN21895_c0_g1_i1.p1 TRINITY_DN21895_c0_g1~~TRINITY_DN21895_c0_g1_i1.p1  ORF type:complete len:363 (-),score=42.46 TRINITY_DN21895_c0_g1_i1:108-1154(-)
MGSVSLLLTALLLSPVLCDGFSVAKWADETLKLPSDRRLPLKKALAAPSAAGLGEGVTAIEYDDALGRKLRKLALAEYQRQGAWARSTSHGFNINICGSDSGLCEEAYSLFLEKAKEVYEPFEIDEATTSRALWAAVSNEYDQHIAFHDHVRSCQISGLVYVSLPDPDSGISFLVNDSTRYIDVTQGVLYFWPGAAIHAPGATKGSMYRISINMEFKTKGGVAPRIKTRYRGNSSEREQLPYSVLTALPDSFVGQPRVSVGKITIAIQNIGKEALEIYDGCGKRGSMVSEVPPSHWYEFMPKGRDFYGITSTDKKPFCMGPEVRGPQFCTARDTDVDCQPATWATDEL